VTAPKPACGIRAVRVMQSQRNARMLPAPAVGATMPASTYVRSLLAVPVLVAAWSAVPASAQVIAKAGTVELTESDVRRLVTALPAETRAAVATDDSALEQLVRNELVRRMMVDEMKKQGFDRDQAALAELERLREDALLRLWIERGARVPEGYPAAAEVTAAYEAAKARHGETAEYRLSQIFLALPDGAPAARVAEVLKKAAELQPRVATGDFAALARQYSEHADSAQNGGDLGPMPESNLIPEVRAAVTGVPVGAVVGPLKTAQGLHFVKVTERRPLPPPALAEIRERLVVALRQQKAAELQREHLAKLGQGTPISVNQVELGKLRAALQ
jgi:peptidylprolyl isomerase